jgi:isopenicillin-N epimerase
MPISPIPGARLLFSLDPAIAHLNHGSYGTVPIGVQRAQQRLREEMEANPDRFFTVGLRDRIAHVRRHVAAFLGADPEGSALVDNATTGAALALNSLDLRAGDEIVLTDHGYGAVALAVRQWCDRTGVVVRTARIPLTAQDKDITEAITGCLSRRTRLVIVDEITSPTARRLPTADIVTAVHAASRGVASVFIDAAHAPGNLDAPAGATNADFWVGNLHKWAFAPRGTALFAVAERWRERIRPLIVSWEQPLGFPANLEWSGVRDYTAWLAAPTGLYTLRTLDLAVVRAHNQALAVYAQRVLADAFGGVPTPDCTGLPMALVPLPAGIATDMASATALRRRVGDELGADVMVSGWNGIGLLRLSAQIYNRPEEYERLAERLPALCRT